MNKLNLNHQTKKYLDSKSDILEKEFRVRLTLLLAIKARILFSNNLLSFKKKTL